VDGLLDGKHRSLFRSGTGGDAAALLTAIPAAAVTSKRTGKEFSSYAADNARFRIQCKLLFRYRLLRWPAHRLPAVWRCTRCSKPLDEFDDHAQACSHLQGAIVTRHNAVRNVLHAATHSAKQVRSLSEPSMLSLGAVPKPELTHQDQAELMIPEHRADLAIIPDPDKGVNFADTLVVDVALTAATSTL
jgi:hypothetical protein